MGTGAGGFVILHFFEVADSDESVVVAIKLKPCLGCEKRQNLTYFLLIAIMLYKSQKKTRLMRGPSTRPAKVGSLNSFGPSHICLQHKAPLLDTDLCC